MPYGITYMWNLKYGSNEHTYRTETDAQTQRTDLWLPRRRRGEWDGWEFEVSRCKLFHLEWISNEVLLDSTGNSIQSLETDHDGRSYEKKNVCV